MKISMTGQEKGGHIDRFDFYIMYLWFNEPRTDVLITIWCDRVCQVIYEQHIVSFSSFTNKIYQSQ